MYVRMYVCITKGYDAVIEIHEVKITIKEVIVYFSYLVVGCFVAMAGLGNP